MRKRAESFEASRGVDTFPHCYARSLHISIVPQCPPIEFSKRHLLVYHGGLLQIEEFFGTRYIETWMLRQELIDGRRSILLCYAIFEAHAALSRWA